MVFFPNTFFCRQILGYSSLDFFKILCHCVSFFIFTCGRSATFSKTRKHRGLKCSAMIEIEFFLCTLVHCYFRLSPDGHFKNVFFRLFCFLIFSDIHLELKELYHWFRICSLFPKDQCILELFHQSPETRFRVAHTNC